MFTAGQRVEVPTAGISGTIIVPSSGAKSAQYDATQGTRLSVWSVLVPTGEVLLFESSAIHPDPLDKNDE
jgi:hypothetical protein